eukprot:2146107-Ditylum_brightwellii.AAC.1
MGFSEDKVMAALKGSEGNPDFAIYNLLKETSSNVDNSDTMPDKIISDDSANEDQGQDRSMPQQSPSPQVVKKETLDDDNSAINPQLSKAPITMETEK